MQANQDSNVNVSATDVQETETKTTENHSLAQEVTSQPTFETEKSVEVVVADTTECAAGCEVNETKIDTELDHSAEPKSSVQEVNLETATEVLTPLFDGKESETANDSGIATVETPKFDETDSKPDVTDNQECNQTATVEAALPTETLTVCAEHTPEKTSEQQDGSKEMDISEPQSMETKIATKRKQLAQSVESLGCSPQKIAKDNEDTLHVHLNAVTGC